MNKFLTGSRPSSADTTRSPSHSVVIEHLELDIRLSNSVVCYTNGISSVCAYVISVVMLVCNIC